MKKKRPQIRSDADVTGEAERRILLRKCLMGYAAMAMLTNPSIHMMGAELEPEIAEVIAKSARVMADAIERHAK